jgi:hypothetical protein
VNADDTVDLAIPQHRIVYFKYKDTKVWDKSQRLDLIFNSTLFQVSYHIKHLLCHWDLPGLYMKHIMIIMVVVCDDRK